MMVTSAACSAIVLSLYIDIQQKGWLSEDNKLCQMWVVCKNSVGKCGLAVKSPACILSLEGFQLSLLEKSIKCISYQVVLLVAPLASFFLFRFFKFIHREIPLTACIQFYLIGSTVFLFCIIDWCNCRRCCWDGADRWGEVQAQEYPLALSFRALLVQSFVSWIWS